jgi:hypothetical protein
LNRARKRRAILGAAMPVSCKRVILEGQASALADHHINRGFLGGNVVGAQREQTRPPTTEPPTENDVRNAIERVTVSATQIEIVLSESIVRKGQDRLLTLPWSRTCSLQTAAFMETICARHSPAMAAVRVARRRGGNSGSAQRIRPRTHKCATLQDRETHSNARGSNLPDYRRAGSS